MNYFFEGNSVDYVHDSMNQRKRAGPRVHGGPISIQNFTHSNRGRIFFIQRMGTDEHRAMVHEGDVTGMWQQSHR
jgi:hypothetical protein